jgi:ATP-dependent DNA ligase
MAFQPMPLSRKPAPFDHPEWIFELKYDGFRALAVIQNGLCQLISRNGHPFNSFTELRKELAASAIARFSHPLQESRAKAFPQSLSRGRRAFLLPGWG